MLQRMSARVLWWLTLCFAVTPLHAELRVQITQGVDAAIPITIVPFAGQQSSGIAIGSVVSSDLQRSGRFQPLAEAGYSERPTAPQEVDAGAWRSRGQEFVVVGRIEPAGAGQFQADFHVVDVVRSAVVVSYRLPFAGADARAGAHQIADVVYKYILGQSGSFATRVAYVNVVGDAPANRQYRLQIADTDGFNPQTILSSVEPLMSPAWSPDGKQLAYVSFENKRPAIWIQNLTNGQRHKISETPGINGAPAWSPDGRSLALTLSKDGDPEIYVYSMASGLMQRLTDSHGIDTEPSWSPDGQQIVFTSDRGGKPQLYLISPSGGAARRLTYEGNYNARGVFSPDGRSMAMVHGSGNGFRIALMDLATHAVRVLTRGPQDESPGFAPNGSMILYASRSGGRSQLSAISADGKFQQDLRVDSGTVREPAWSP